ncbi:MFS transporter, partial [Salmonella enterica]|uniref:MFS transporter n=1 Tax=Salmonella enterica TaxID=28901 RepID=UPI003F8712E3
EVAVLFEQRPTALFNLQTFANFIELTFCFRTGVTQAQQDAFSYSGAWRWMLGVIIIPAILLLIGVFFLPDSPRWFAAKRRF